MLPKTTHCGTCPNCQRVLKTQAQMLSIGPLISGDIGRTNVAGLTNGRGHHDDGTVQVWNDTLRDFPCTHPPTQPVAPDVS